jgi:hypothetical protein
MLKIDPIRADYGRNCNLPVNLEGGEVSSATLRLVICGRLAGESESPLSFMVLGVEKYSMLSFGGIWLIAIGDEKDGFAFCRHGQ